MGRQEKGGRLLLIIPTTVVAPPSLPLVSAPPSLRRSLLPDPPSPLPPAVHQPRLYACTILPSSPNHLDLLAPGPHRRMVVIFWLIFRRFTLTSLLFIPHPFICIFCPIPRLPSSPSPRSPSPSPPAPLALSPLNSALYVHFTSAAVPPKFHIFTPFSHASPLHP